MKEYQTISIGLSRTKRNISENLYNPIDILLKVWYLIHGTDKKKGAGNHGKDSLYPG